MYKIFNYEKVSATKTLKWKRKKRKNTFKVTKYSRNWSSFDCIIFIMFSFTWYVLQINRSDNGLKHVFKELYKDFEQPSLHKFYN